MKDEARKSDAMRSVTSGVEAWEETVAIPTYPAMPADKNPMFLEKRVYQGSSGRVYPLPFTDRVSTEIVDQEYRALHVENEHVYLMVLPEIGGRIQVGYDKQAEYDFFYRQDVIKPALVGLAGPWISGGVEFNWPQHHRPSTYMPCEWTIEEGEDGSKTIWLSEHEPMNRMKGMHGICLRPGSSVIELKVRLYNRTPYVQTFLWWANVAAKVHERYQSFFPPDVRYVGDHAKRATVTFPHVSGDYYGVRYGERGTDGVPKDEMPRQFVPDGTYPPDRLDWYANIPVPTSYMVLDTAFDFFGGYDHSVEAGFVHFADRRISPGKKQWTWGNHEFGYAWDRNLTESGGPYVELMAGVYTDNQPDFSYLAPHETKTFSQFWYPIRKIGPPHIANTDAALAVTWNERILRLGVCVTRAIPDAVVEVLENGEVVWSKVLALTPEQPLVEQIETPNGDAVEVRLLDSGRELLHYSPLIGDVVDAAAPKPAAEPALPADVPTNDELYLVGVHLEQYRHATRSPADYWHEAIRRDPGDSRCRHALGRWHLGRGEFEAAVEHLASAIGRQKERNPNPRDGEAHYDLGLALVFQGRLEPAYDAFAKAAWNYGCKGPASFAMARLACRQGEFDKALGLLNQALLCLGDANSVHHLKAALLRQSGRGDEVLAVLSAVLTIDPMDHGALYEASLADPAYLDAFNRSMRGDPQNYLDLAFDYIAADLDEDAIAILRMAPPHSMVSYVLADLGRETPLWTDVDYVFPCRLEEMCVLERAIARNGMDSTAQYLLGNLYYDRRRYGDAYKCWMRSAEIDPGNSIVWRNLGILFFNVTGEVDRAKEAYDHALAANPADARLLFERDQLLKRLGVSPEKRLDELAGRPDLILVRDDLALEVCSLYNATGQPEKSRDILESRRFAPWEGGEGIALSQHARTFRLLAAKVTGLERVRLLEHALTAPENLGEARHLLANASDLWVALGDAVSDIGDEEQARGLWRRAAEFRGDFQEMAVRSFSEMTYFRALALRRLGSNDDADTLLRDLLAYSQKLEVSPAKIDYFATSLPTLLLFGEDLLARQSITARFLSAQALWGLGDRDAARAMVGDVLSSDPNHAAAQDLCQEMSG
ncbi:MAG: DUF5107 domain-containing protein [Fimbriimonas sp.]|nr:DUF5107 domain-containing protein [Fimbriimonas sp.]